MRGVMVGGGIAGPVLGMFLHKVGIDAVILEARHVLAAGEGAFLGIAPNGMNVLAALELDRRVLALGHVSRAFSFRNARDRTIGQVDQSDDVTSFGQPMVMIRRSDLHHLLLGEAERRGLRIVYNARVSAIDMDSEQVTARTEDGKSECADFLVGCDGLRSRTRSLLFPELRAPEYAGLLDFAGFTPLGGDEPLVSGCNTMVFGSRAFFGAFVTAQRELWWFHNGGEAQPIFELSEQQVRARLLAEHAEDPPWIKNAIARTERILGPWPMHVVPNLSRWHRDRVCLIGDAAHATTPSAGQGASLALEDAMLLARSLRDLGTPERSFAAFERLRRPRVAEIAAQARRNSNGKAHSSAVTRWVRDRMLQTFLKLGAAAQQRAYAYRVAWPEPQTACSHEGESQLRAKCP